MNTTERKCQTLPRENAQHLPPREINPVLPPRGAASPLLVLKYTKLVSLGKFFSCGIFIAKYNLSLDPMKSIFSVHYRTIFCLLESIPSKTDIHLDDETDDMVLDYCRNIRKKFILGKQHVQLYCNTIVSSKTPRGKIYLLSLTFISPILKFPDP